jgi:hypothetical protein
MAERSIPVQQLLNTKFTTLPFTGRYRESFGVPQSNGIWLVWGNSGNGKTRFLLDLAKYMTNFAHVRYNSLEEGARLSLQIAAIDARMIDVKSKFQFLNAEPIPEMLERFAKPKSPGIGFIDSWQYLNLGWKGYQQLKDFAIKHNKLFIINSHADGKLPEGRTAKRIKFDVDVKIRVEGFKAFPSSRFKGNKEFVIWEEGAAEYWGIQN